MRIPSRRSGYESAFIRRTISGELFPVDQDAGKGQSVGEKKPRAHLAPVFESVGLGDFRSIEFNGHIGAFYSEDVNLDGHNKFDRYLQDFALF